MYSKPSRFHPSPRTPNRLQSPGGLFSPASPYNSPFRNSHKASPKKLFLGGSPLAPYTPSRKDHRVGGISPSPLRRQHLRTPGRQPANLVPRPMLSTMVEECAAIVDKRDQPLTESEQQFVEELRKLEISGDFERTLAGMRHHVNRAVEEAGQAQARSPAKAQTNERKRKGKGKEVEPDAERERERARQASFESRTRKQRDSESILYQERLAATKRRRVEREEKQHAAEISHTRAAPTPATPSPAYEAQPGPSQAQREAEAHASRQMREKLEAARLAEERQAARQAEERQAEEVRARLAQQEEARLAALREQARQVEAEKLRIALERSQAEKAQRRVEELRRQADEKLRQADEERRQADEMLKRADEERARAEKKWAEVQEEIRKAKEQRAQAQRHYEERFRAMQEEAQSRLEAQRMADANAQREAFRLEQEARLHAERDAFLRLQAEQRRIAEQAEDSFATRMARLEEMGRLEADMRKRLEEIAAYANLPRNALADFFLRLAAERATEEDQARRAAEQEHTSQHGFEEGQPQSDNAGAPGSHQSFRGDVPMREASMDASMYSVLDDTPYADDLPDLDSADPPPPPRPPTVADLFAIWEAKWKYIDEHDDLSAITLGELPWPTLRDLPTFDAINAEVITEFLSHSARPRHLSTKRVVSYYHSDRFKFRVLNKLHPGIQRHAEELAHHCTILLLNYMH